MSKTEGEKEMEAVPAMGIPYAYPPPLQQQFNHATPLHQQFHQTPPPQQQFYYAPHPHQSGMIPPNAVFGDPKGIPIIQTVYADTPAPFNCQHCGSTALTTVGSKLSLAAVVACMMPFCLGVCFLCPSMNCLWHKYHYCPSCGEKVAEFEKNDPCLVVDPPNWEQPSYALPA